MAEHWRIGKMKRFLDIELDEEVELKKGPHIYTVTLDEWIEDEEKRLELYGGIAKKAIKQWADIMFDSEFRKYVVRYSTKNAEENYKGLYPVGSKVKVSIQSLVDADRVEVTGKVVG